MASWLRGWLVVMLVALGACSGPGDPIIEKGPEPDSPCQQVGAQACTLDDQGRWIIVRCTISSEGELFWRATQSCQEGCKDGHCVTAEGDLRYPDVETPGEVSGDTAADQEPAADLRPGQDEAGGDPEVPCRPTCEGKACGDDGCGGSCGACPEGQVCDPAGQCCTASCQGKLCGDDGCGGSCGGCPEGMACNGYFQCAPVCQPDCVERECGPDGCGGSCGDCPPGKACGPKGLCSLCVPQCDGKECGPDGCGGNCGACPYGQECKNSKCQTICVPNCAGKTCGDDGCGGSCGGCLPGEGCVAGKCQIVCVPTCAGKECGGDGCGGSCGKCPSWAWCSAQGSCLSDCVAPDCTGKECGSDGCGGSCGACAAGQACGPAGTCLTGGAPCAGLPDGGWCDGETLLLCVLSKLVVTDCKAQGKNQVCEWLPAVSSYGCYQSDVCVPDCTGVQCGSDGCGGNCGNCAPGLQCVNGQCQGQGACGEIGFAGCCEQNSALWCDNGVLWHMDCGQMKEPNKQKCGWNWTLGFYDCIDTALPGPSEHPYSCQGACVPTCAYKQCGSDGCGGNCGECPAGTECVDFLCQGQGGCGGYSEKPACQGDTVVWCEDGKVYFQDCKQMGPFYHCGWVADTFTNGCYEEKCTPDCEDKACGDDGCGYVCGYCPITQFCNDKFQCVFGQGMCGDIDYIGKCEGNLVKWCQNGILQQFDCKNLGPTWQCGWFADGGYYWCIEK